MREESLCFLKSLCSVHTPTGFELKGQRLVAEYAGRFADETEMDVHGNLHLIRNRGASCKVLLDAHVDEIGLIVQHIDKKGFIYVQPLGGMNMQLLPGERIIFDGPRGPVNGCVGRKAIHLMNGKEREAGVDDISSLWVDIGSSGRQQTEEYVPVGTSGVVNAEWRDLLNENVSMRGFDDRSGVFSLMETLRKLSGRDINVELHVVSATQEEVGLLGAQVAAFGIRPDAGIAVDVTFASDHPKGVAEKVGDIRLGAGPVVGVGPAYDRALNDVIRRAGETAGVPVQIQARNRGNGTDAFAIRMTGSGVPVAQVSIPLRYMHSSVEVINLQDLDAVSDLLAETVASMPEKPEFGHRL